ncbi:[FeFe] hydrogenase H-cluster maturation GTPase HydF [Treponema sp. OMZ 840]|uniref:[FeFe] hydrogenase H-cluster maturation GTPase HydF n=1 Tax=Treponema sp. OMZ 840 TaxID=244313 RepID=UPI003D933853
MSLNTTASAERIHISFFGKRNAGKSSLVNAVTGQNLCVVSDIKGTTTDPVKKAMELLPLGPAVIIDTPGIDDTGELGLLRIRKTEEIIDKTDIAVLVAEAEEKVRGRGFCPEEQRLIDIFCEKKLPFVIAYNKSDLVPAKSSGAGTAAPNEIFVSAKTLFHIHELKEMLASLVKKSEKQKPLVSDLIEENDIVVLVIPIDEAAPKGRLILPQQAVIRDILEKGGVPVISREYNFKQSLSFLTQRPALVITDSQVFGPIAASCPEDIPLTSFSILMARYKGDLSALLQGAALLKRLKDGDKVLICEGCTHHRQCKDIGTVKIPGWIENFCGAKPDYTFTSGGDFPKDLSPHKLIVHCGACMLTETEMKNRIARSRQAGVPVVNYGIAIAHMHGILQRSLAPFPQHLSELTSYSAQT